jgi:hypothetical protein
VTDTRWQCRDCSAMVYPYCELCPHCGGARPEIDKHGALPPVDWKARHAAIKAERGGK